MTSTADTTRRSDLLITATRVVGAVFVLVGILGFVPGITTNFGDMGFAGHTSDAHLLGVFQVSILHNIVHLLYGVVGLAAARNRVNARRYLIFGGVIYLVLWLYGLLVSQNSSANFVPLNGADDWLHLGLGLGMLALGFVLGRDRTTADRV